MGLYQQLKDWLRKAGSVGQLVPHLEARLVADDGQDVEEGAPGELWLRGACTFKGYLRNAEATKAVVTEDGWFKTGDVLTRDSEGFFTVTDRKKELIKYKVCCVTIQLEKCWDSPSSPVGFARYVSRDSVDVAADL